ncbi:MAG: oligosaccharide flippase family protein [Gracilimonas sp.]|uniref:oligosaccharide flippase family protein n=1 Tax=Gracilimonas sp. TaxID=1974203 RepID=UPI00198ED0DC|nr:oligosaccharide flippase family protein [Gracilimonas sp.]MBD3615789.1 oligosaccharide flippase family protein [Gracilimonas sp.]
MNKLKEKAFWIALGDIAGRGLSFVTSVYLARTLGAEFYGLIVMALSILGYATWLSDLGLHNIGTRETAKEPSKRIFRVLEIFRMKLFLGIAVLIVSTFLISMIDSGEIEKQVILGYLYSLIPYMALMEWFYTGKQEFRKIAASKIFNGLVYFLLVLLMIKNVEDVTMVPVLYTVGISVSVLTLATFAIKDKPFTLPSRGTQIYPDLLKTSSVLGLGQFFAQVVHLLPPLLIGALLSLHDAGIYGVAFRIVIIAIMIDRVFVTLLIPNLSSLWSKNRSVAIEKINIVYQLISTAGALLGLFMAIGAEQIIGLLYGNEYTESVIILQVLSVMIAITFINSFFSFGLIATNKDKEYFLATCFGGTISALVIFSFVALGNTVLVAVSVSIAEVIITMFTYFWFRKIIPSNFIKPLVINYIVALLLFGIFSFSPLTPLINASLASIIFVIIITKFGVVNQSHINYVKSKLIR